MTELKTSSRLEKLRDEVEKVLASQLLKVDALTKFLARLKAAVELEKMAVIIEDVSLNLNGLNGEATLALISGSALPGDVLAGSKGVSSEAAQGIVETNSLAEYEAAAVSAEPSVVDGAVDHSEYEGLSLTGSRLQLPNPAAPALDLVEFILALDAEQNGHRMPRRGLKSGEVKREIARLLGRSVDSKDPSKKLSALFLRGKVQRTDNRYWIPGVENAPSKSKTSNSTTSNGSGCNGVSAVGGAL